MGGPTGVGNTYGAGAVLIAGGLFQGRDLALGLINGNILAIALVEEGNASRIVSAVFKPMKTIDDVLAEVLVRP